MTKKSILLFCLISLLFKSLIAQPERWQQHIKYHIDVAMDAAANKFSGKEKITYTNNSPDTLDKLMFHLYWNAFQPNSSMDVRSRELGKISARNDREGNPVPDWDDRVRDRIVKLTPDEIGYQRVKSVTINGVEQKLREYETILEVRLTKPILPHSTTDMEVAFDAQVPIQVRRSGRNNAEGIQFSMSQWYPKMVEYDYQGWNANPYVAREFYGVWGDYDVVIQMDKRYKIAATGVLQTSKGEDRYAPNPKSDNGGLASWHFKGENIHDFVWAADTDYKHISKKVGSTVLNVFYKTKNPQIDSAWNNVLWAAEHVLPYMEQRFGKYLYPQYSFIQGGDGGMEYAMATLLKGYGLGTVFHEWAHSWYQHMLGTNESLFPWMDEGFTSYAEDEITSYYNKNWAAQSPFINNNAKIGMLKQSSNNDQLPERQSDNYSGYFALAKSPIEEPMTTHADHFNTNFGYSLSAYAKGAVFLNQLGYIIGDKVLDKTLLEYYNKWHFKHPNANDFIRIAEKTSGITLQWYKEYWVYTTKTIDYGLNDINFIDGKVSINLSRVGKMPMPIDVLITYKDGSQELHYIPLNLMYGEKAPEDNTPRIIHPEWRWTHPTYSFTIERPLKDLKSIEIDPTQRMADINRANNKLVVPE